MGHIHIEDCKPLEFKSSECENCKALQRRIDGLEEALTMIWRVPEDAVEIANEALKEK